MLQAGLEEQTLARTFNLSHQPQQLFDYGFGVPHGMERFLALALGHPSGLNLAVDS